MCDNVLSHGLTLATTDTRKRPKDPYSPQNAGKQGVRKPVDAFLEASCGGRYPISFFVCQNDEEPGVPKEAPEQSGPAVGGPWSFVMN
jgi:hypothetical protein